jgi:uncharacterized protein YoxC
MTAHADHSRRRLPVVGGLPGAAYLGDRLNDVVQLLSALPEIVVALRAIQEHIENVDHEVHLMRTGVDKLAGEVGELRGEIQELGSGINEVSASVGRLEPHVSDLSRLARPLRRRRRTDTSDHAVERRAGPSVDDAPSLPDVA